MKRLYMPVKKLAWGTDWHLNFLRPPARQEFVERIAEMNADAFAITGDISDGINLEQDLQRIGTIITKPVFMVLGNHDRYHSSFAAAEHAVKRAIARHPNMLRLTGAELVELSTTTALLGVDGWADGTAGAGSASKVELNDSRLIRDFANLPRAMRFLKMRELAEEYALTIEPTLIEAMGRYPNVIVLSHVPPLPEATWHEGKMSDCEHLPHFCNQALGRLLRSTCTNFPTSKLTLLCGHTHGEGMYCEGNMTVFTGSAEYFNPKVNRIIDTILFDSNNP
jgi:predicted phosphohydrolase